MVRLVSNGFPIHPCSRPTGRRIEEHEMKLLKLAITTVGAALALVTVAPQAVAAPEAAAP
jgi:hypothetical protein